MSKQLPNVSYVIVGVVKLEAKYELITTLYHKRTPLDKLLFRQSTTTIVTSENSMYPVKMLKDKIVQLGEPLTGFAEFKILSLVTMIDKAGLLGVPVQLVKGKLEEVKAINKK